MADLKKLSFRDPTTGEEKAFSPVTEIAAVEGLSEAIAAITVDTALTGTPTAPTAAAGTNTTQIATTAFVTQAIDTVNQAIASGVNVRGTLGNDGTITALPESGSYTVGDMYVITTAGTYAEQVCEVGDYILCIGTSGTVADDWSVIQANIDRAVTGPASATDGNIAVFDGATGLVVKDGGVSIASLQYTHYTGTTPGTYDQVTVNAEGHVTTGNTLSEAQKLAATGITSTATQIDAAVSASGNTEVAVLDAEEEVPKTLVKGGLIIRANA